MNQPSLDELLKKVDSRYTLVVLAAKRARALNEIRNASTNGIAKKPVTIALQEIASGKIKYRHTKEGMK